ncbi:hypothetical protein VULLAG_LOCUS8309 [Vulpes lagopus]
MRDARGARSGQRLRHVPASRGQAARDWLAAPSVTGGGRSAPRRALLLVAAAAAAAARARPGRAGEAGGGGGGGAGGGCRFRNRRSSSLTRGAARPGCVGPRRAGPLGAEAAWGGRAGGAGTCEDFLPA